MHLTNDFSSHSRSTKQAGKQTHSSSTRRAFVGQQKGIFFFLSLWAFFFFLLDYLAR